MFRTLGGLFILVVALALIAPPAWADGTPTPEADQMHMEGTPEADHDADHGARVAANGASIKIVSPVDGAVLAENSAIVKVETTNWPLGEGKHWHLYVNGQEQGMSQGGSPSLQARDLLTGANVLEAVMSNELHQELDAVARIVVQVESGVAPATTANTSLIVAVAAGAVAVIGGLALLLMRKK